MEFMVPHALQTANAPLTHRRDMLLARLLAGAHRE